MFESLSNRLGGVFDKLRGKGALREGDVDEAMREIRIALLEADVVLMDINFKGRMSGLEGIRQLRAIIPDIKVLMLSMYADEDLIFDALRSGAFGYLFKMGNPERIIEAIRSITQQGTIPIPAPTATRILETFSTQDTPLLTQRELQLLELIKQGLPYNHIPDQLMESPSTIDSHLRSIYEKLHNL